jgi:hypothetical protein
MECLSRVCADRHWRKRVEIAVTVGCFGFKSGVSAYDPIIVVDHGAITGDKASMSDLLDAYGNPFDPRPFVARWKEGDSDEAAALLWERLYHQGDLGSASIAAVPDLASLIESQSKPDWQAYALIATIEEARVNHEQPLPEHLSAAYADAWNSVLASALRDLPNAMEDALVRSLIAVIAHAKGQHSLATIALCTEDEREEMLG